MVRKSLAKFAMILALSPFNTAFAHDAIDVTWDIQALLRDYGCYRNGIDGVWGPASQQGLRRYLSTAGYNATGTALQPTHQVLEILIATPVTCR